MHQFLHWMNIEGKHIVQSEEILKKPSDTDNIDDSKVFREPKCSRCRIHGIINDSKGHKYICAFRKCGCAKCKYIAERQRVTARRVANLRKKRKHDSFSSPSSSCSPKNEGTHSKRFITEPEMRKVKRSRKNTKSVMNNREGKPENKREKGEQLEQLLQEEGKAENSDYVYEQKEADKFQQKIKQQDTRQQVIQTAQKPIKELTERLTLKQIHHQTQTQHQLQIQQQTEQQHVQKSAQNQPHLHKHIHQQTNPSTQMLPQFQQQQEQQKQQQSTIVHTNDYISNTRVKCTSCAVQTKPTFLIDDILKANKCNVDFKEFQAQSHQQSQLQEPHQQQSVIVHTNEHTNNTRVKCRFYEGKTKPTFLIDDILKIEKPCVDFEDQSYNSTPAYHIA